MNNVNISSLDRRIDIARSTIDKYARQLKNLEASFQYGRDTDAIQRNMDATRRRLSEAKDELNTLIARRSRLMSKCKSSEVKSNDTF